MSSSATKAGHGARGGDAEGALEEGDATAWRGSEKRRVARSAAPPLERGHGARGMGCRGDAGGGTKGDATERGHGEKGDATEKSTRTIGTILEELIQTKGTILFLRHWIPTFFLCVSREPKGASLLKIQRIPSIVVSI